MRRGMYPRALALAIFAALAVGVATAAASGVLRSGDKEIQKNNTSCSELNGARSLGVARFFFTPDDNKLTVEVNIKHGLAESRYTVILLDADTCTAIGTPGAMGTNRKGKGKRTFKGVDGGESSNFVIDVYEDSTDTHNLSEATHFG